MRYLSAILACMIFILSLLPCTDGQEHIADSHIEHHESHIVDEHSDENSSTSHDHEGNCPPFCTCNCCGVTVSITELDTYSISFFNPEIQTEFHYSFHYSHLHPTIVWQPPTA